MQPSLPSHTASRVLKAPAVFDLDSAVEVLDEIHGFLARGRHLVVDLSAVEYMNQAAVTVLLWAYRRLGAEEGSLTLTGLTPQARSVLSVSGVLKELAPDAEIPRQPGPSR
ncbi:MAG TPA: STAS domain-containing protein [Nocardioidaceae bacterium]|nr:STAS domain-containing protein [Nocardioidaceae bacterium]